jgi:hypothetical protein
MLPATLTVFALSVIYRHVYVRHTLECITAFLSTRVLIARGLHVNARIKFFI